MRGGVMRRLQLKGKKPKQPRLWIWVVLARTPQMYVVSPWSVYDARQVTRPDVATIESAIGSGNVRVRRVEVKP